MMLTYLGSSRHSDSPYTSLYECDHFDGVLSFDFIYTKLEQRCYRRCGRVCEIVAS
jgi:hypothetical protein